MGHYDDCYQADQRNQIILNKRRLIEMVQNSEFDCLMDAAEMSGSPTVMVKKADFELIVSILKDLEPQSYTPKW